MSADAIDPRERRERCITVYGRRAVLEVLRDEDLEVVEAIVAKDGGGAAAEVAKLARRRGVRVRREDAHRVSLISGNGKQDQGVVVDVVVPEMTTLAHRLADLDGDRSRTQRLLVLDGITTPANLGLVLRSATAAGSDGIVLPRRGVAELGPLAVKASAGTAFRAPILRAPDAPGALDALTEAGFEIVGLDAGAAESLWDVPIGPRVAFLLGGERAGPTPEARAYVHRWASVPMAGEVESLNVACAATLVAFEIARRGA